jgi:hypothetical protein
LTLKARKPKPRNQVNKVWLDQLIVLMKTTQDVCYKYLDRARDEAEQRDIREIAWLLNTLIAMVECGAWAISEDTESLAVEIQGALVAHTLRSKALTARRGRRSTS